LIGPLICWPIDKSSLELDALPNLDVYWECAEDFLAELLLTYDNYFFKSLLMELCLTSSMLGIATAKLNLLYLLI